MSLTAGHLPEFLLPFRKPKRIRTAFSPSQLLKLEQAFEKNQYVVGAERKELAKTLNLSETQVRPASSRNLASEFMRIKEDRLWLKRFGESGVFLWHFQTEFPSKQHKKTSDSPNLSPQFQALLIRNAGEAEGLSFQ